MSAPSGHPVTVAVLVWKLETADAEQAAPSRGTPKRTARLRVCRIFVSGHQLRPAEVRECSGCGRKFGASSFVRMSSSKKKFQE